MNITDAAKAQLEALLKENKADGLMMQIATSCCDDIIIIKNRQRKHR